MSEGARIDQPRLTEQEFFAWLADQDGRYELVDGQPVMMTGAQLRHSLICGNAYAIFRRQLHGTGCRAATADLGVRIPLGNIRYPDVVITCDISDQSSLVAANPVLVVEILSRSTKLFDETGKLDEYKLVSTLRYILHVDPDTPKLRLYTREEGGAWPHIVVAGLESVADLSAIGISIPLADLYEDIDLRPRPTLVVPPLPQA